MAALSSMTMIRALSLFHLTLAYFFLTSPRTIAEQNLVFLLGQSMRLPHTSAFNQKTPVTAFLAVVFALLGLSDLTAASMSPDLAIPFFNSQAPIRLLFLFVVTGYTYLFKKGGMFAGQDALGMYKGGIGEELKNSVVFSWGFLELTVWFWIFLTLRDERRQAAIRSIERQNAEARRL